jgi:poly(3-hydroxybutyrate) depolymerase
LIGVPQFGIIVTFFFTQFIHTSIETEVFPMRRNVLPIILSLLLFSPLLHAQPEIVAKFGSRLHTFQTDSLPYRFFIPEQYDSTKKYPLVLTLHGSGERGNDNLTHIAAYRIATSWADPTNQVKYPCFVASPQVPFEQGWTDYIQLLDNLLDSLTIEFSLDTNRFYVTGLSMGGFGTFELLTTYPDRFAAGIPMSSGWNPSDAPTMTGIPIWNFHGTRDETVPVSWSRDIVYALADEGVPVVHTHCRLANCDGLPDSLIDMHVRSHAQLIYTEFVDGPHDIWNRSYDYPFLFPWVFSQYRRTAGAIALTSPSAYQSVSGDVAITWAGGGAGDSVEIWFSPDLGERWELVTEKAPNTGTYLWSTGSMPDVPFGELRVFLKNPEGFIYGVDRSGSFSINNPPNGEPFVRIRPMDFEMGVVFQDTVSISYLLGDPEDDPLSVNIDYVAGSGTEPIRVDSFQAQGDTGLQTRTLWLGSYPNSDRGRLKMMVTDGSLTGRDTTFRFPKNTPRAEGPEPDLVAGGGGKVTVHVVDPSALTGNLYRVRFDDSSFSYKTYNVRNVTTGQMLVEEARELDGITEGPEFEGIRLLVEDFSEVVPDMERTKWVSAAPTIVDLSPYLPTVLVGADLVKGVPHPADYRIEFSGSVADTSSGELPGFPPLPVPFTVQNLTEGEKAVFVFADYDLNGVISNFDEIYLLEPDSLGVRRLSWGLTFSGSGDKTFPQAGDIFEFRTRRPITSQDVYEFSGIVTSVASTELPQQICLFQNYPNPFNPATTIRFALPRASVVTLRVFDLLGREVALLMDGQRQAGSYEVLFDGTGLASGVYFYRLQVDPAEGSGVTAPFVSTRKLLLLK